MEKSPDARIQLLGPVQVRVDGVDLALRGSRQERLVAALALELGRVVTLDRLVDVVWHEHAPTTARRQVQDLVSWLRRDLVGAGCPETVLGTRRFGYLLDLPPSTVDAMMFQERTAAGLSLRATDPVRAAESLRSALALWHGDALAGLTCPALDSARVGLDELRLIAWERCLDIELTLDGRQDLLSELAMLVETHPSHERLVRSYMYALYRAGRTTDAIDAFHRLRHSLATELAVNPGHEVQRMYDAIVRDDPGLVAGAAFPDPAAAVAPGPRSTAQAPTAERAKPPAQLPPDNAGFTGRRADLVRIDELVAADGPSALVITALAGMAGVGKTALALRWAHRAAHRFPDGQLYVNLRGYDHREPLAPTKALAQLLTALGVPADRLPADEDAAAGLWRTLLAGKRTLVLLDNARSAAQVRPLLPGGHGNVVLVTSRDKLTGLVAVNGATSLVLDVLAPQEAVAVLSRVLGAARVEAEPTAALRLAALCGHLPLALRIAGARLALQSERSISEFADDLAHGDRLGLLQLGDDPRSAIRPVFEFSYEALAPREQRLFRLLGPVPGGDFTEHTAAALLNVTPAEARATLDRLAACHLVTTGGAGRYGMHDLVRMYAAERSADDEPAVRDEAMSRIIDSALQVAAAANAVLSPRNTGVTPQFRHSPVTLPFTADTDAIVAYLDAEIANIAEVVRYAAEHRTDSAGWHIAYLLSGYLDRGRRLDTAIELVRWGVDAAAAQGDPVAERRVRITLGALYNNARRPTEALDQLHRAVELARLTGAPRSEAAATNNIGRSHLQLGEYGRAVEAYAAALALYEADDPANSGIGSALNNLGDTFRRMREGDLAMSCLERAVVFTRRIGDQVVEAFALTNSGHLHGDEGRYGRALDTYRQALALARATGHRYLECEILVGMARAYRESGDLQAATDILEEGLELSGRSGNGDLRAMTLVELAAVDLARGDVDAGLRSIDAAQRLRRLIPDADEQRRIGELRALLLGASANQTAARSVT